MSYQMRYPQAPWGEAWMNAQPTEVDGSAGPRVPVPRQVAVPNNRRSMGAALMGPNAPQDNPNGFKSRLGAAIQGLGSQLDPNGGGFESFLSGATGGYTNTQQNLRERAQAPFLQAQAAQEQSLKDRETQSRIDYYRAQATRELRPASEANAPRIGAADWVTDPKDPTRQLRGYTDPRSGVFVPQTLEGEVLMRPTPTAVDRPRNIDPLSDQGIERAGRRAEEVGRAMQSPLQAQAQAFGDRADAGSVLLDKTVTPSIAEFEAGRRLSPSLRPESYRLWRQAAEQFITAVLRKESGAAISDSEFARYTDIYIPTPGDSPELLARKKDARDREIRNLYRSGRTNEQGSSGTTDYTPPPE